MDKKPTRYWVITDLETSGVYPEQRHEILQLARVVYDIRARKVVPGTELMRYVTPQWWSWRDNEAMQVNGLEQTTKWIEDSIPLSEALADWSRGVNWTEAVVAAWGIDFEAKFLTAAYKSTKRVIPYPYCMVDLRTLFYGLTGFQEIKGLGEAAVSEGLLLDVKKQHDALYDVQLTTQLIHSLIS